MIYLVGIRLFSSMRTHHNSFPGSVLVTLITCLVIIVPLAELFYRLVQQPSRQVAHRIYDFVTS
jgi:peptidoglycan/LPS O-acetylase OafA/YrhL